MRSPQPLHNGETSSPHRCTPDPHAHFHSTVALCKLRRFNLLILFLRLATFCFSLASSIFMITNPSGSGLPRWYDFDAFRFVLAPNGIAALYSLFELIASVWEISRGVTLFPKILQVWFDFGHDQVFSYLLLSAGSVGTELARTMKVTDTCTAANVFCVQSDITMGKRRRRGEGKRGGRRGKGK